MAIRGRLHQATDRPPIASPPQRVCSSSSMSPFGSIT
jgi:hypothetical protein